MIVQFDLILLLLLVGSMLLLYDVSKQYIQIVKKRIKYKKNSVAASIIKDKYPKVGDRKIKSINTYLNNKCHDVSYFISSKNPKFTVAKGYLINKEEDEDIIPHFTNFLPKSNMYLDSTLGARLEQYDFYIVDNQVDVKSSIEVNHSLAELQDLKSLGIKLSLKDYLLCVIS